MEQDKYEEFMDMDKETIKLIRKYKQILKN